MRQSVIPSILASLGYVIVLFAMSLPLLEWHITEILTDYPTSYEVHFPSRFVSTKLGESLDVGSVRTEMYISMDVNFCRYGDTNIIIRRSNDDKATEEKLLKFKEIVMRLEEWMLIGIVLSTIYIWWFKIWYKQLVWDAVGLTGVTVFIFLFLTQVIRPFLWGVGVSPVYFGELDCTQGTVTLNVGLFGLHYETLAALFVGIVFGITSLGVIVRSVINALIEKKNFQANR